MPLSQDAQKRDDLSLILEKLESEIANEKVFDVYTEAVPQLILTDDQMSVIVDDPAHPDHILVRVHKDLLDVSNHTEFQNQDILGFSLTKFFDKDKNFQYTETNLEYNIQQNNKPAKTSIKQKIQDKLLANLFPSVILKVGNELIKLAKSRYDQLYEDTK